MQNEFKYEEGEVVLCEVDKIIGTTVFVHILNGKNEIIEGSIIVSEIAPGRIRNLRDYVVPKKIIACKILHIKERNIELSLRRVTPKEKKEVLEAFNLEKRYLSILKSILGDKTEEVLEKIKKEFTLHEFFIGVKEGKNMDLLRNIVGKSDSEKLIEILKKEKQKKSVVKKEITLKTKSPKGITIIKEVLKDASQKSEVNYIGSGKYSLKLDNVSLDIKKADHELQEIIKDIEKKSKKLGIEFAEIKVKH